MIPNLSSISWEAPKIKVLFICLGPYSVVLRIYSGITPGVVTEPYGVLEIEPQSATYKPSAFSAVLLL